MLLPAQLGDLGKIGCRQALGRCQNRTRNRDCLIPREPSDRRCWGIIDGRKALAELGQRFRFDSCHQAAQDVIEDFNLLFGKGSRPRKKEICYLAQFIDTSLCRAAANGSLKLRATIDCDHPLRWIATTCYD